MTNRPFLTLLQSPEFAVESEPVLGDDCLEERSRFSDSPVDEIAHQNSSYLIRDNDYRLLEMIDRFDAGSSRDEVIRSLRRITLLLSNVSVDIRLPVFRKLNACLASLAKKYASTRAVFDHATQVLLALRQHMDENRQSNLTAAKLEWVELEKAVYHLSLWEESFEHMPHAHA